MAQLLGTRLADAVKYSRGAATAYTIVELLRAVVDSRHRAKHASRALRKAQTSIAPGLLFGWAGNLAKISRPPELGGFPQYEARRRESAALTRTVLLKPPGAAGEKGVLYVTFEYNWWRLLRSGLLRELSRKYDIVFSTSWSPADYALLRLLLEELEGPLFLEASNAAEGPFLSKFDPRIRCLPTMPCDWVDPSIFDPLPAEERTIDLLMVANWAPFKRHWELFVALGKLPPHLRVTFVGQPEGEFTMERCKRLAETLKVPQDLTFLNRVPYREVVKLQCRSRASVILTRNEGSCVAATEALFAGAALGIRADARVGALKYVTPETGVRLDPRDMSGSILQLLETSRRLSPRETTLRLTGCDNAGAALNAALRDESQRRKLPWTRDIAGFCWRPYPVLRNSPGESGLGDASASLTELSPALFPPGWINDSSR